jgi:hypothetical protein
MVGGGFFKFVRASDKIDNADGSPPSWSVLKSFVIKKTGV